MAHRHTAVDCRYLLLPADDWRHRKRNASEETLKLSSKPFSAGLGESTSGRPRPIDSILNRCLAFRLLSVSSSLSGCSPQFIDLDSSPQYYPWCSPISKSQYSSRLVKPRVTLSRACRNTLGTFAQTRFRGIDGSRIFPKSRAEAISL